MLGPSLGWITRTAKRVEVYNNLWKLASLNASTYTKTVFDQQWQVERKVSCWSHFIEPKKRCEFILVLILTLVLPWGGLHFIHLGRILQVVALLRLFLNMSLRISSK